MRNRIKNYYVDDDEMVYRCCWISWRVFKDAFNQFQTWHISNWIRNDRYDPTYLPMFSLYLSYTTEKILRRIYDEMGVFYPNEEANWKQGISYSLAFCNLFEFFFKEHLYTDNSYNESYFDNLQEMLDGSSYYNDEYKKFWGIIEIDYPYYINDEWWDANYNTERLCVFHLNNIVPVTDKKRALIHLRLYKELDTPYFDNAFFNLSYKKIKSTLWK